MQFEQVMKRQRGLEPADTKVVSETLTGYPVIGNTSGIREGEIVNQIFGHEVVIPNIQGQKRSPTVVLKAGVIDSNGELVPRIVFLSTLIRKIDLNEKYQGMIESDANFKDYASFTNQDWINAFTKAAPFMIETVNAKDREVNMTDAQGNPTKITINVKEVVLQKMSVADAKAKIKDPAPAATGGSSTEGQGEPAAPKRGKAK